MIGVWRNVTVSSFLLFLGIAIMPAESKETKNILALEAHLDANKFNVGAELKPSVHLVNVSGKPLKIDYLKPLLAVPEIWDAANNERVPNAPTYIYSQARAYQTITLPPDGGLDLYALPILLAKQSPPKEPINHAHSFWATLPGSFKLKYSFPLKELFSNDNGVLHAKDLEITIVDPDKELGGVLSFEHGKGYYLSMGSKGGKGSIWLKVAEDKVLVKKLDGLIGTEVKVHGCLQRVPRNAHHNFPDGSLYFSEFQIK